MTKRILHITTHMGGGVGKVLSGISTYASVHRDSYNHDIMLLEEPEKLQFVELCQKNNISVRVARNHADIAEAMKTADIVQLEWWHHPLMCGFLAEFPQIPIRLVIWSHISGCYYPWIPDAFLILPHKFVFTSQYSYDNPYWQQDVKKWAKFNCAMVNSSGNLFSQDGQMETEVVKDRFCVGYMGTLAFSKLHPDFVKYCKVASRIAHVTFRLAGDMDNADEIIEQAAKLGIADKIKFSGYVQDVSREFAQMDVFGYILNSHHFGTTENVLLEAMDAGLPVICLQQCAEQYLVEHNKTGLLVKTMEDYRKSLEYLFANPQERRRLGENARLYVRNNFSVDKTIGKLNHIYDEVMGETKRCFAFNDVFGGEPKQFFESCLPPPLCAEFPYIKKWPHILCGPSKSSLLHFRHFYPADRTLQRWCKWLP